MVSHIAWAMGLVFLGTITANAQLVPAPLERLEEVCPQRPANPAIIENMGVREGHVTLLLQSMYKAAAYQDIAETGTCGCDQRFPSWEPVVAYYLEHYAGSDDHNTIRGLRKYYRDSAQSTRPTVREICIADGNW